MVKHLRLLVLNDNEPALGLLNEWGWSIFAESEKWSFLFDADTNPWIIQHNSRVLGVDLKKLNFGFLSHYHLDHYGGYRYIGNIKPGLKLYAPSRSSFLEKYGLRVFAVENATEVEQDVWSSGSIKGEHAAGLIVRNKLVVVVGCSHPGVDKLTETLMDATGLEIHLVIGGFHMPEKKGIDRLASITEFICPAHCTGNRAKEYIKHKYPEKYCVVKTGTEILVG